MTLRIAKLNKSYRGGVQALDNLSLTIECGLFGLLGPNGSGKSTLMRILATLLEADSGEVSLDEINLLDNPQSLRRLLGYLPQSFGAYPKMTAFEMLDYLATMKGIGPRSLRREVVEAKLATVNLFDVRHRRADKFSGGMVRRLGIAQAMLGDPKLLIVDEPTTGLDPLERQYFYRYLAEISSQRIVVLATHLVEDIRSLCRDMAILSAGRILIQGHPEEIVSKVRGSVWTKHLDPSELDRAQREYRVINTRWDQQQLSVDVISEEKPGAAFREKELSLQDAYFAFSNGASTRGAQSLPSTQGASLSS